MAKDKTAKTFNTPLANLAKRTAPTKVPPAAKRPIAPPTQPAAVDDADLFAAAVGLVRPVQPHAPPRVEPSKREQKAGPSDEEMAVMEFRGMLRDNEPFRIEDSEEHLSGAAPGVSHELEHALAAGTYSFRRHIDLHGLHQDEAKSKLTTFLLEARRDGERCILVITGRGKSSPTGVSVLRQVLPRWLSRAPLRASVLAFCSAQPEHGGAGAFYVLLRRPQSK